MAADGEVNFIFLHSYGVLNNFSYKFDNDPGSCVNVPISTWDIYSFFLLRRSLMEQANYNQIPLSVRWLLLQGFESKQWRLNTDFSKTIFSKLFKPLFQPGQQRFDNSNKQYLRRGQRQGSKCYTVAPLYHELQGPRIKNTFKRSLNQTVQHKISTSPMEYFFKHQISIKHASSIVYLFHFRLFSFINIKVQL